MSETELAQRVERLERDNRWLRSLILAGLALLVVLILASLYPLSSIRVTGGAHAIKAHEFDVVDNSGRVRVQASVDCSTMSECSPKIRLFGQDGKALATLGTGTLMLSGKAGAVSLSDADLRFVSSPEGEVRGAVARIGITPSSGGYLSLVGTGQSHFLVNSGLPRVEIGDSKGYIMELGAADLTTVATGQTNETTAASIVMFANDKQHHVIWQMP